MTGLEDRLISRTTHLDPEAQAVLALARPIECGNCHQLVMAVAHYPMGRCACGQKDWRRA